jgi:hypothetical protein
MRIASITLVLAALWPAANAQTVTGQISGTVVDPGGGIVPNASVQLINDATRQTREFTADGSGNFLFPDLVPGAYDIRISQPGFKTYAQNGIVVGAQEKLALHELRLEVGGRRPGSRQSRFAGMGYSNAHRQWRAARPGPANVGRDRQPG